MNEAEIELVGDIRTLTCEPENYSKQEFLDILKKLMIKYNIRQIDVSLCPINFDAIKNEKASTTYSTTHMKTTW